MATFSPVRVCVAALTFPKVPLPKVLPMNWLEYTYNVVTNSAGTIGV